MMALNDRERLLDHAKRPIRAFLRHPDEDEEAFWNFIYAGHQVVPSALAERIADELEHSPRKVGELLEGWRPRLLR